MVFIAAREYGHSKVTAALEDKHKEYSKTEFSNNIRELGKLSAVGHNQLLREYSSAAGGLLHEVLGSNWVSLMFSWACYGFVLYCNHYSLMLISN